MQRIRRIVDVAGINTWLDMQPSAVEDALAKIMAADELTPQTRNDYLTACNMFANWMVKKKRTSFNPIVENIEHLEVDEREHRRSLDPEEAARLFAAADAGAAMLGRDRSGNVRWEMTGPTRAVLYRLACETGLRRGAIERLEVGDIDTGSDPNVIIRGVRNTKEKKNRKIPLRRVAADLLRRHFADKLPAAKAFNMPAKWETADMVRADLEAARAAWISAGPTPEDRSKRARSDFLAPVDAEGRRLDFHAMRTTCASWLDHAGVASSVAKRVTGHRNEKTLERHYQRSNFDQARRAVNSMPDLSGPPVVGDYRAGLDDPVQPESESVGLAPTGTDGGEAAQKLAPMLAPDIDFTCLSVSFADSTDDAKNGDGDAPKSLKMSSLGDECRHLTQARVTGIEPATSGSTVRCSNQLSYTLVGIASFRVHRQGPTAE
jgi:integrase